ncbi:hypothetical protein Tco_1402041 [Tanacetum coccineum]
MAAGGWEIGMTVVRWLRWRWCRGDGVGSEAVRMVACCGSSGVVEMVASFIAGGMVAECVARRWWWMEVCSRRLENLAENRGGVGGRKNGEERELGARATSRNADNNHSTNGERIGSTKKLQLNFTVISHWWCVAWDDDGRQLVGMKERWRLGWQWNHSEEMMMVAMLVG